MSIEVHFMATMADRNLLPAQCERARQEAEGLPGGDQVSSGVITRVQVLARAMQRSASNQLRAVRQLHSASGAPVVVPDESQA